MPYKILLADNDKITHRIVSEYLSDISDYALHSAFDGQQALEIAKKQNPDIIIADVDLPLIDGFELITKIRNQLHRRIPFLLSYTDYDADLVEEALRNGITDIIKKPFERLEFLARIKAAISYFKLLQETHIQREQINSHEDELNKLSLIVKKTANAVVILNTNGDIEWVNEGFTQIYGYTLDELIKRYGKNLRDIATEPDLSWRKFEEVLTTRQSVSYVNRFLHPSGQLKWLQTTLTPIFEGNEIDKIVAIETDITREKKAEITLKRQKEELERLTRELQEKNEMLENQWKLLQEERSKVDGMLENFLPKYVIRNLMQYGYAKPRNYKKATVMFADFKDFTPACKNLTPDQIVDYLNFFFTRFDEIVVDHYIEKIKTIGDAYMCVGGVPVRNRSHPFDVVLAALKFQYFLSHLDLFDPEKKYPRWELRIGIHTGPLVAGIVGKIKFAYDVWGDTVNTAQRLQTACEPGRVNISATTYSAIKDYFICEPRGLIEVKHGGKIDMYYVKGLKPEYAADETGVFPNEEFKKFYASL